MELYEKLADGTLRPVALPARIALAVAWYEELRGRGLSAPELQLVMGDATLIGEAGFHVRQQEHRKP